jgi:toxin CcdB
MARFDVYASRDGGYLLDCQADVLSDLNTRFCVPLMPPDRAPLAGARLNPEFEVNGERVRMVTQFAGAIFVRDLGERADNLADQHTAIMNAIDMLTTGY